MGYVGGVVLLINEMMHCKLIWESQTIITEYSESVFLIIKVFDLISKLFLPVTRCSKTASMDMLLNLSREPRKYK